MKDWSIRLGHIWQMIPENHRIALKVKRSDSMGYYSDGYYDRAVDPCPYYRQFAVVLSVYAITTEILEVTINENMPVRDG